MIGRIKKFDEELYNKYDVPARELMKKILGTCVSDNPDIYKEDMILNMENSKYKYLELQVCTNWISDKYPYEKPFVYARKKLFSDKTLFVILNRHMTCCLLFDQKSLLAKPRRLKRYSRTFVYEVPWYRVIQTDLDDLPEIIPQYF